MGGTHHHNLIRHLQFLSKRLNSMWATRWVSKIFIITIPKHNTNYRNLFMPCHKNYQLNLSRYIPDRKHWWTKYVPRGVSLEPTISFSTINSVHRFCYQSQYYSTYEPSCVDFDPLLGAALHSFYEVFSDSTASVILRSQPRQRDITTLSVIYQQAGRRVRCVWERIITQDR